MAAQFVVNDPTIKLALLSHYVQQIDACPANLDELLLSGVSGELIDFLRTKATAAELARIAKFSRPAFVVTFDDNALMASFEQAAQQFRDEQIKEHLARSGATNEQLAAWYCMSLTDADALRRAVSAPRFTGRPGMAKDHEVREAIHAAWCELPAGTSEREAYYSLSLLFPDESVGGLYKTVHEHDTTKAAPRKPKGKPKAAQGTQGAQA